MRWAPGFPACAACCAGVDAHGHGALEPGLERQLGEQARGAHARLALDHRGRAASFERLLELAHEVLALARAPLQPAQPPLRSSMAGLRRICDSR